VVQGSKPESHLEHEALHCACHHASELEHICQIVSAFLHSLALLISWQASSQFPTGCDVVPVTSRDCPVVDVADEMLVAKNVLDVLCSLALVLVPGAMVMVVVVLEVSSSCCVVEAGIGLL